MEDSEASHNEEDWSWDESDKDWKGTQERREKEKKIKRYRKRNKLEEKTVRKACHMIGLGPVRQSSIGYFNNATADYSLAK